jgi:hypothetical protein
VTRDAYTVLGVSRGASLAEIKAAYRARARLLHPDRQAAAGNPDAEGAHRAFLELTEAFRAALADTWTTGAGGPGRAPAAGTVPAQRRSPEPRTGVVTPFPEPDPMLELLELPRAGGRSWPTRAWETWVLVVVASARTHLAEARRLADAAGARGRHRTPATVHALLTLTLRATAGPRRRELGPLVPHLPAAYAAVERRLPATVLAALPEPVTDLGGGGLRRMLGLQ